MIDELIASYNRVTGAYYRDALTGLYTYGIFSMILSREVKKAERTDNSFTVGVINIDFFSLYNKRYGTVEGDKVLRRVADIIQSSIRDSDFCARCYGDIFAVILDGAQSESAGIAAERIRSAVERDFDGLLTVSIGLSFFPLNAKEPEELLRTAQESLIQAQHRGKNAIHFFEAKETYYRSRIPKVLVVDDERANQLLLTAQLEPLGYEVITATTGEEAVTIVRNHKVNLVLLDVLMPGMDGYEVCRRIKKDPSTRLVPVVMITALEDRQSKVQGIEAGADDFLTKPPIPEELIARTKSLLNVNLLNQRLTSFENVLYSLANAVNAKDHYTQGHASRVAQMAEDVGREMELDVDGLNALKTGGLLHDVGKIGVSERILNKPGKLTEEEMEEMKRHPVLGYTICLPLKDNLGIALDVIRHHHERLDGSSYPDGLKGEEVSIYARIMAVVDAYDALTTNRPYRQAYPPDRAIEVLQVECDEGKMDQQVVDVFQRVLFRTQ
ncbi:MAG: HD domain-containing phosphohydrolase [Spirochaetota bacterium]